MTRAPKTPAIVTLILLGIAALAAPTMASARHVRLHKPRRGFQMRMTPFSIPASGDREACEVAVTPNDKPVDVGSFELKTTPGTHHFVVWQYMGDDRNPADFWDGLAFVPGCTGLGPQSGSNNANMFGMLSGRTKFSFPAGIAVRLEPHAVIYPNLHYHNYSDEQVAGQAVFNFIPARKGTVRHHAQAFTLGTIQ